MNQSRAFTKATLCWAIFCIPMMGNVKENETYTKIPSWAEANQPGAEKYEWNQVLTSESVLRTDHFEYSGLLNLRVHLTLALSGLELSMLTYKSSLFQCQAGLTQLRNKPPMDHRMLEFPSTWLSSLYFWYDTPNFREKNLHWEQNLQQFFSQCW